MPTVHVTVCCGIASAMTPDLRDEHSSGRPINAALESLNKRSVSEAALFFRNLVRTKPTLQMHVGKCYDSLGGKNLYDCVFFVGILWYCHLNNMTARTQLVHHLAYTTVIQHND